MCFSMNMSLFSDNRMKKVYHKIMPKKMIKYQKILYKSKLPDSIMKAR